MCESVFVWAAVSGWTESGVLADELAEIKENFSDILVDGSFTQCSALPEETGEPALADLPRLVFHFDRHALGRLRKLIDVINQD